MQRTSRKPSCLPRSLNRHLDLYALAATASGVAALALAPVAEAKIIYTPTHQVINSSFPYYLFLGNKNAAFTIKADTCTSSTYCGQSGKSASVWIRGQTNNGSTLGSFVAVAPGCTTWDEGGCALALRKGSKIPTPLAKVGAVMAQRLSGDRGYSRYWRPDMKDRYLGLTFQINGKTHYGWARLKILPRHHPPQIGALLTGYAYETIPGKPIVAGRTEGPDVVTVQPTATQTDATLGALALGRR